MPFKKLTAVLKQCSVISLIDLLKVRKQALIMRTAAAEMNKQDSQGMFLSMKSNMYYASNGVNFLSLEQYKQKRILHDLWEYNPYLVSDVDRNNVIKKIDLRNDNFFVSENIFKKIQLGNYEYKCIDDRVYLKIYCKYDKGKISKLNYPYGSLSDYLELIRTELAKFTEKTNIKFNSFNSKEELFNIIKCFDEKTAYYIIGNDENSICYDLSQNLKEIELKTFSGEVSIILSFSLSEIPEVTEFRKVIDNLTVYNSNERLLLSMDSKRASIQEYDNLLITDNNLGSWDLFCNTESHVSSPLYRGIKLDTAYESRDPRKDIQKSAVAIDFGTTSTVVAVKNNKGQSRLVRIGVQNMQEAVQAKHFENPTVLGIEDYESFMNNWQACPYKPYTKWADLQCSHQAKAELADKMQSGLAHIKTWARGKGNDTPLRLTDQKGHEILLKIPGDFSASLEETFNTAEFNPIEVYAYLLGLNLNNQLIEGGKIYTDYYMTFPVKFDRETKDRILASFRRGLLRSLPPSLIYAEGWNESSFKVTEHANEPTAFAAAVLPLLPLNGEDGETIKATQDGLPFGVFDFGGGTTDFSFGVYRLPTAEEEGDYGWEQVLDILDSSGDENLGGEHLVQQLAFSVIKNNVSVLLENNIAFTKPVEYEAFSGDELLFSYSGAARTNMAKLCEKLRPVWENGELDNDEAEKGIISETFISSSGEVKANIPLKIDLEELRQVLAKRIEKGVEAFFTTFRQAFKRHNISPQSLHIVLAGNSCKSPYVQEAFEQKRAAIIKNENSSDNIIIHKPLLADPEKPESVTLKTGVALGLLKTLDTEPVGIVVRHTSGKETFFNFTVGTLYEGKLKPVILRDTKYHEWKVFGKVFKHGKCKVLYSQSPMAIEGSLERERCTEETIDFGTENFGKIIMIQAISPYEAVLALSSDGQAENIEKNTSYSITLQ